MYKNIITNSIITAAVGAVLLTGTVNAAEFYFGEDDGTLLKINSQLTVGASWRVEGIDPKYFYSLNGGTGFSGTTDDGAQNFKSGETFSKIIKGLHDIELSRDNYGAFVRVKYWYDKELNDEMRPHGNSGNGYTPGVPLSDEGFADNTKFSGIELLDAYVYSSFDMGDVPVDLRIGRQVVSWGESTFIQGGINSINPFDVSALRRPGAELKEGLMPVGMVFANAGLTEKLSIEAFYQFEWDKTEVDGCGTYFSTADFIADGCNWITVLMDDRTALAAGVAAKREADLEPSDSGQYGLAARYFAESLNSTEFGLYYMNIHSRLPMINAIRGDWSQFNPALPVFLPHANALQLDAAYPTLLAGYMAGVLTPEQMGQFGLATLLQSTGTDRETIDALNPGYAIVFPEDLKVFGLSFATNIGGFALSGEVSFKPDSPVQINGNHVLAAALAEPGLPFTARLVSAGSGGMVEGWNTFDITQVQFTGLQFIERVLGASRLTLLGEVGMTLTDGVEDMGKQGYFYGRNPVFGLDPTGQTGGFVTDTAWGYRLLAALEYSDVFAGIALKPVITFAHDVSGYGPEPGQQFNEGTKVIGLSLEALYQQKYSMTLSYKAYSGGDYSILNDKDFVSLSFGISY